MSVPSPSNSDKKARLILAGAAKVFSEKGYHHASMRDIASETGISLAGMYYYFSSKEEMLFSIQHWCFREVIDRLENGLGGVVDPHEQLRVFVRNHLDFFIGNVREMKVLSHESESLTGEHLENVVAMKREYFRSLTDILRPFVSPGDENQLRQVGLSIFGMVNWIYTWYDPDRDGTSEHLAETMCGLVRDGLSGPPA